MGWWTALRSTIGTRQADRIARAESDQLLAGQPVAPQHARLAALLSEAAAPPRPEELVGEAEVVAAFRRLRSAAPSTVDGTIVGNDRRQRVAFPPWHGAAVRLAVTVLLAAAGTATITLGYRPTRMQPSPPQAPSSSVPAPSPSPSTSGTTRPTSRPTPPSPTPSPASVATQVSDLALATQLCQVWTTTTDKATRDQAAAQLQALMASLDGPNGMPAFCKKLINAQSTGTTTPPTTAAPAAAPKKSKKPKKGG